MLRGRLIPSTSKVYTVDAFGWCESCQLLSPFRYRLHSDLSLTGIRDGEWVRWQASKRHWPTWVHVVLAFLCGVVVLRWIW